MWRLVIFSAIVVFFVISFSIQHGYSACIVNEDWPEAPCLDTVVNGCYDSELVKKWMTYYDYKGASIMEEKRKEMFEAFEEKRLKEWESESHENINILQYYYLKDVIPRFSAGYYKCPKQDIRNEISSNSVIPPPHKQLDLGVNLGHIICDEDKILTWNIHFKPACVFPDSEMKLLERGWAKLRLILPASADPIKELEWTGQNEVTYRILGNIRYGDEPPPSTLDEKKKIVWEYAQKYHPQERFLEYSIPTSDMYYFNVGDIVQFELLEWGNYSECWNLKLRIIDIHNQPVYEDNPVRFCLEPLTGGQLGWFASYSMGEEFKEFVCDHTGYYRIEVSNGDIFPPTILQNFACLDTESSSIGYDQLFSTEIKPDIVNIESDKYVHLSPVDKCASVQVNRMSQDYVDERQNFSEQERKFVEVSENNFESVPKLKEMIVATHAIDPPQNNYAQTELGLLEFVDYEMFLMQKAIQKYNDTKDDYFVKLDENLEEKLANPQKEGFSNEFLAPRIVYKDNVYALSHTVFWVADEHEPHSLSLSLQDEIGNRKFIVLTDDDMESIPKLKETISKIGKQKEYVIAFK